MSKELINEIESKIAWNDMDINETSISLRDVKRLLNELEEQVERFEEQVERAEELERKIERYREALEFYADEDNYCVSLKDDFEPILQDNGKTAQQALKGETK